GVVVNGELVRGRDHIAGEFGHMPLSLDGPRCLCGMTGCWEAYVSNLATLSRYFGWNLSKLSPKALHEAGRDSFTVLDLVARARAAARGLHARAPAPARRGGAHRRAHCRRAARGLKNRGEGFRAFLPSRSVNRARGAD